MIAQMNRLRAWIGVASFLVLTACGGGGGGEVPVERTGIINIAITDATVDVVTEVNVQFSGVTLKPQSGDKIEVLFDTPKNFDLLTLSGGMTAELLPDTRVPAGSYNWIRLAVNAEFDNVFDSYAMLPEGLVELRVPGGSQSGLKLVSGFTVTQNQSTNIVIDWDLRKALSDPAGQPGLQLRPALRVTNMAAYGTLNGTVAEALVNDGSCTNDLAMDTGNAVYVYAGVVDTPGDIGESASDPLTTATVSQSESGTYVYEVNFLSVGEYTAAFTCQADDDDPETDDPIEFPVSHTFSIKDGATSVVDF
jgi:hypothetical protein